MKIKLDLALTFCPDRIHLHNQQIRPGVKTDYSLNENDRVNRKIPTCLAQENSKCGPRKTNELEIQNPGVQNKQRVGNCIACRLWN